MARQLHLRRSSPPGKQKGLALVTVMLVIALCVVLAAEISTQQGYQIQRAKNLFERQQAFWYAMSSEHFVKGVLVENARKDKGVVNLEQPWAMKGMSFPVDNGLIEGRVTDLQSCFNLNSLYNAKLEPAQQKKRKEIFVRYLESLDVESEVSFDDLAANLIDWLDADDYPSDAVGYDGDMYASLTFPYLSANSPLAHENELRVIYGFDVALMAQLKDKFCVIPEHQEFVFNINTITEESPELLMALLDIDKSKAEELLAERPEEGFEKVDDFFNIAPIQSDNKLKNLDKSQFTVESKFFKLVTNAFYNDMKFALTSVIQLDKAGQARVIARRFGGEIEREADPEDEPTDS